MCPSVSCAQTSGLQLTFQPSFCSQNTPSKILSYISEYCRIWEFWFNVHNTFYVFWVKYQYIDSHVFHIFIIHSEIVRRDFLEKLHIYPLKDALTFRKIEFCLSDIFTLTMIRLQIISFNIINRFVFDVFKQYVLWLVRSHFKCMWADSLQNPNWDPGETKILFLVWQYTYNITKYSHSFVLELIP